MSPAVQSANDETVGLGEGLHAGFCAPGAVVVQVFCEIASEKTDATRYVNLLPHASVSATPRVAHGTTPNVNVQEVVYFSVPAVEVVDANVGSAGHGSRPFA